MISIEKFNRGKNKEINKYYIAYGSNMDLDQMKYRVRDSVFIGTGYIENYRLEFRAKYATIVQEEGFKVPVVIFGISEEDESSLDRYEGYPKLYYKSNIKVKLKDSLEELECMVYIMEKGYKYKLPEVGYYENMEISYKFFGFDLDILERGLIDSFKKEGMINEKEMFTLIITDNEPDKILSSYESEDLDELLLEIKNNYLELESYIINSKEEVLYFTKEGKIFKVQKF